MCVCVGGAGVGGCLSVCLSVCLGWKHTSTSTILIVILILIFPIVIIITNVSAPVSVASCETKCYKNEQLGDAEGNVYHCYGDEKPDCCQQNSEFTCCESNDSKTW